MVIFLKTTFCWTSCNDCRDVWGQKKVQTYQNCCIEMLHLLGFSLTVLTNCDCGLDCRSVSVVTQLIRLPNPLYEVSWGPRLPQKPHWQKQAWGAQFTQKPQVVRSRLFLGNRHVSKKQFAAVPGRGQVGEVGSRPGTKGQGMPSIMSQFGGRTFSTIQTVLTVSGFFSMECSWRILEGWVSTRRGKLRSSTVTQNADLTLSRWR